MKRVQALVIMTSDDGRAVVMRRVVGELVKIEDNMAVLRTDFAEVRVPVNLVREMDKPNILQSAIAQLSAEVLDDKACLHAAVGEVIERAEPVETGEYVVDGEDYERMVDAFARIPAARMVAA